MWSACPAYRTIPAITKQTTTTVLQIMAIPGLYEGEVYQERIRWNRCSNSIFHAIASMYFILLLEAFGPHKKCSRAVLCQPLYQVGKSYQNYRQNKPHRHHQFNRDSIITRGQICTVNFKGIVKLIDKSTCKSYVIYTEVSGLDKGACRTEIIDADTEHTVVFITDSRKPICRGECYRNAIQSDITASCQ